MSRRHLALALASISAWASALAAQGPDAPWRTLETAHYRIHFPAPAEAWTARVAARLEAIRARVGEEVGFTPGDRVDVVVMDPQARPNGMAVPRLGAPRMVLYTTPPDPESALGHYRDWGTLLVVHEQTHLAHLLRPSRNPLARRIAALVPVGPIARAAPRWLSEGYATLLEGDLTGYGRPHGDLRAAVLRRWAQRGELPGYGRLSGSERWLGMSMPYLLGSAYLEWLRARTDSDALRRLWRRMSARRARSFEKAFRGVFGGASGADGPATLYNRFRAELTFEALMLERERAPAVEEGVLWLDLSWTTGAPAISPDGAHLAVVLRARDKPSRLAVFATAEEPEARQQYEEARARLLARDPQDVPSPPPEPPAREPRWTLPAGAAAEPQMPRWCDDERLVFVRFELDPKSGARRPDLFRWTPGGGQVERLTRGAGLRHPDPAPGCAWAVAVRHRWGLSELVRVILDGPDAGRVEPLVAARAGASTDTVYAHPRLAPDGRRLAWVENRDGRWRLIVGDFHTPLGPGRELAVPEGATVAHPAWSADGRRLYAAVSVGGYVEIHAYDLDDGTAEAVARNHGGALAPAPTPDGEALFFLALEPDGLDLRRLALGDGGVRPSAPEPEPISEVARVVLTRPATTATPAADSFAPAAVAPSRPYGLGRLEAQPLAGGVVAPSGDAFELGLRLGDAIGRFDLLALGSAGGAAFEGGALTLAWRGLPVALEAHLATLRSRPSRQGTAAPGLGDALDVVTHGLEVDARWRRRGARHDLALLAGAYAGRVEPLAEASGAGTELDRTIGVLRLAFDGRRARGRWRFEHDLDLGLDLGRTGGDGWQRAGGRLTLALARGDRRLTVAYEARRADGTARAIDRLHLGGVTRTLEPRALAGARIAVPVLPAGTALGDDYRGWHFALRPTAWPLELFYQRHRLGDAAGAGAGHGGDWLALRGLELRFARGPWPLLRLPALELRAGVAEILDPPFEDEIEGWLSLGWRP